MNLLIAMMTHTFTKTYVNATAEHRLVFAKLAKEFFEKPVLPMPLGLLEILLDRMLRSKVQQAMGSKRFLELGLGAKLQPAKEATAASKDKDHSRTTAQDVHRGDTPHSWGRHFTFPVSSLPEELKRASSRYRFQQQKYVCCCRRRHCCCCCCCYCRRRRRRRRRRYVGNRRRVSATVDALLRARVKAQKKLMMHGAFCGQIRECCQTVKPIRFSCCCMFSAAKG